MTHYEILGITGGASLTDIESAYKKKSREIPIDNQIELKQAYKVLMDPTARELYDDYLVNLEGLREEEKYRHFVEKQEENQLNDGTLLSKWKKFYRLDWQAFNTLTGRDKLTKIFAELFFRTVSGIIGVIIVVLFLIYAGNIVDFFTFIMNSPDAYIIKFILLGVFLGIFVASKYYGELYRNWRLSRRSD